MIFHHLDDSFCLSLQHFLFPEICFTLVVTLRRKKVILLFASEKRPAEVIAVENMPFTNLRYHLLKTVEPLYSEVVKGAKTAELRVFDRDFQVGDYLLLLNYPSVSEEFSFYMARVTHIMTSEDHPALTEGYAMMSFVSLNFNKLEDLVLLQAMVERKHFVHLLDGINLSFPSSYSNISH